MSEIRIKEFKGLDLRRDPSMADPEAARVASNVYLTSGKNWRTRPGVRLRARLPEETKGLYAAAGVLRTVAPAGYSDIFVRQVNGVFFDFIGDGSRYGRDQVDEFINAERFGASVASGGQSYIVIRRKNTGQLEHHYIDERPTTPSDTVDTLVRAPFQSTGPVIKLSEKLWVPSQPNGSVQFSSTQFGPTDWTTPEDAGALPVLANAPGDRTVTAVGFLQRTEGAVNQRQSALVVFFEDGCQIWGVDPDPLNHYLTAILDGPGTENYRSVANVLGDPVFLSRQGFRSLRISSRAGSMEGVNIGSQIDDLTIDIDPNEVAASIWYDRLGLYLCAVGSTIYTWKYDPFNKVSGWSTWEMPWGVTDMVDYQGSLWIRTVDDEVYELSPDFTDDDGAPIAFEYETQFNHAGSPGSFKNYRDVMLYQRGAAMVSYRPDPADVDIVQEVYVAEGVTRPHEKIPIQAMTDSVALRFSGEGAWQLDGYTLHYAPTQRG